jgi:hypothetical protein
MNTKSVLIVAIASLGAAALLGAGAWGLLGPGSAAAANSYGVASYTCAPFDESAGTAQDADWGMMGGFGMMGAYTGEEGSPSRPAGEGIATGQVVDADWGMMEGFGMMDGYANEPTAEGSSGWWTPCAEPGTGPVSSLSDAVTVARRYIASSENPNLVLGEVMEFSNNDYAVAVEKNTGIGAFEFLIDPSTGAITPEPGPNRVWNTKYGSMGGPAGTEGMPGPMGTMMGGGFYGNAGSTTAAMPVSVSQARSDAQQYLSEAMPGTSVSDNADRFYGYYTFHVLRGQSGPIMGMLSVNGTTGAVWYHNWHGSFIAMKDTTASQ